MSDSESPSTMENGSATARPAGWWRSLGPGIIIASVVFGPGSLMTSSKIGALYGYDLLWVLLLMAALMGSFLLMAARIGMFAPATPCTMVAQSWGRPWAVLIGLTVCLICGAFQFGNNVAVAEAVKQMGANSWFADNLLLPILNAGLAIFLFAFKHVYKWIERVAMVMVGVMLAAFAFNLVVKVHPPILDVFGGIFPSWPEGLTLRWPTVAEGKVVDPTGLLASFVGTTFVVAGAFLQASLVREKGWSKNEYARGVSDMLAGVFCLALISGLILVTAGTVLRGLLAPAAGVGDLAAQLRPTFGPVAHGLFCLGMLAAALSSVLVNAMMAGMILADGVGLPARMSNLAPRVLTILVLGVGMLIAMLVIKARFEAVNAIIFAQAVTVLGNPLMVIVLLWLANSRRLMGPRRNGVFLNAMGIVGFVVVAFLASRVAWRIILMATLSGDG